jgi:hypothetical protein
MKTMVLTGSGQPDYGLVAANAHFRVARDDALDDHDACRRIFLIDSGSELRERGDCGYSPAGSSLGAIPI